MLPHTEIFLKKKVDADDKLEIQVKRPQEEDDEEQEEYYAACLLLILKISISIV